MKFSHGSWSPFEQDIAFVIGVKERHRTVDAKNQLELCVAVSLRAKCALLALVFTLTFRASISLLWCQ